MQSIVAVVLLFVTAISADDYKRYDGYMLYSVYPTDSQVPQVQALSDDVAFDFWYEGKDRFDIFLPPHKIDKFVSLMTQHGIKYDVAEHNVQGLIDAEHEEMMERQAKGKQAFDYNIFNTLEAIHEELDDLVGRCPPSFTCDTVVIGNSYQGRPIKGIRVRRIGGATRRIIWIDATIHAREWLATATLMKIIQHVFAYTDPEIVRQLGLYDFYLLPVNNPDGYSWTHTNDRMWRKNRSPNAGSTCIGTDLNRNYDQMWGNAGASTNPCSETYRGASPASEPETIITQGAIRNFAADFLYSMHIHTYGHLFLIPWGSVTTSGACNFAADDAQMMVVANAAANAIQSTYNLRTWARGNSCATIYPASGITMDYTKGVGGTFFTVTPELRGTNFVVPVSDIEPSFRELFNGHVATVRALEAREAAMEN